MRNRQLPLLAVVIVLAVLGWLLLPGARGPEPGPRPDPPAQAQQDGGRTVVQSPRDAGPARPVRGIPGTEPRRQAGALPDFLPPEAAPVIRRIQQGAAFPHRQDGSVFGNRERRLPRREHGYYREYTVPTPGLSHRGARRIVTGGDPPREWYYSDDHYDSFRPFQPPSAEAAR